MFAAINIHKPLGFTSHDVVAKLRRIFNLKRIGHLGTLDPLAEGVLPVCLGQATRLIEYFPTGKRYTATITLGKTTTTLDSEGETTSTTDCRSFGITAESVNSVLSRFKGTIQQQVPLYSAVHVGGKKLYQVARKQERAGIVSTPAVIELPTREITINHLQLMDLDMTNPAHPVLVLDVACSSGTYIRSLARDIGEAIGCGAFLSGLVRTEHGKFYLQDSISLETLQQSQNPECFMLNPLPYLEIPLLPLQDEDSVRRLAHGQAIRLVNNGQVQPDTFYLTTYQGKPVGVVSIIESSLKPVKIFPPVG